MPDKAILIVNGKQIELPILVGSEGEQGDRYLPAS